MIVIKLLQETLGLQDQISAVRNFLKVNSRGTKVQGYEGSIRK